MTPQCETPISEGTLIDYWARDLEDADETQRVEAHLFGCADCSARLERLAALGAGLTTLARQGRFSGVVSRTLLNRLQRDGVRVRMFSILPGETVPCAVFPGDELMVAVLRADFTGVDTVKLSVTGPGGVSMGQYDSVPVLGPADEVLWANPATAVREMPSMRIDLALASAADTGVELGRYALEHSASGQPL
jgi:hypothetical protein